MRNALKPVKSLKSIATDYGLYLGGIIALLTVIAYAFSLELLANMWYGFFIMAVVVGLGVLSVAKVKQAQGYASFKESFTAYFITIVIGILISTLVSYLLFNIIDTEAAENLKQITIEKTVEMMKNFNAPSEAIAQTVETIETQDQYALGNILKGLGGNIILYSIIGLIVAAAMKKNNPNAN
ncbi:MAG: DUF4199 domain-containing protein [Flavobacteriaceae bacterium]